jgi:hypothetical protein
MHQPIRDNLEEYLRGPAGKIPQEFKAHLQACEDCASELRLYQLQAEMLRALRPGNEAEPRAGFYARVMDRIETQGRASIWSVLLDPAVGRRLAVACATLVVLLGTYFVATELSEPIVAVAPSAAVAPTMASAIPASIPDAPAQQNAVRDKVVREDNVRQQRQRNAVLVNLASFHE